MRLARKRLIITAALLLVLPIVSPAQAGWNSGDIGFVNMERVCRDGALVTLSPNPTVAPI
jgi:hypothetical protein